MDQTFLWPKRKCLKLRRDFIQTSSQTSISNQSDSMIPFTSNVFTMERRMGIQGCNWPPKWYQSYCLESWKKQTCLLLITGHTTEYSWNQQQPIRASRLGTVNDQTLHNCAAQKHCDKQWDVNLVSQMDDRNCRIKFVEMLQHSELECCVQGFATTFEVTSDYACFC